MIYFIEKGGKFLTNLSPLKFDSIEPNEKDCYWYRQKPIALAIAEQLGANIKEISHV